MPPRLPTKVVDRTRRALFGLSTPSSKNLPAVIPDTPVLERIIRTPRTRRKFLKDLVRTVSAKLAPRLPLDILSRLPLPSPVVAEATPFVSDLSAGLPAVRKFLEIMNEASGSPVTRNWDDGKYLTDQEIDHQDPERLFDDFVDAYHQSDPGKGLRDAPGGKHHDWPFPEAEAALAKLTGDEMDQLFFATERLHEEEAAENVTNKLTFGRHAASIEAKLTPEEIQAIENLRYSYMEQYASDLEEIANEEIGYLHPDMPNETTEQRMNINNQVDLVKDWAERKDYNLDDYRYGGDSVFMGHDVNKERGRLAHFRPKSKSLPKRDHERLEQFTPTAFGQRPTNDPMGYNIRDTENYKWSKADIRKHYNEPNYDPTTEPDYTAPLEKLDRRNVMQQTPLRLLNMLAGGLRDKTEEVPRIAYDTVDETVREGGVHPDTPKDIAREAHREVDKAMNKAGLHENTLRDTIRDDFVPWVRGLFK